MRHSAASRILSAPDQQGLPGQANAILFYHLACFVAWGHSHRNLAADNPELDQLVECATKALTAAGTRD